MKIIKRGNPKKVDIFTLTCNNCFCVFQCEEKETIKTGIGCFETNRTVECPECKANIYFSTNHIYFNTNQLCQIILK